MPSGTEELVVQEDFKGVDKREKLGSDDNRACKTNTVTNQ